jgi:hypothetical protein
MIAYAGITVAVTGVTIRLVCRVPTAFPAPMLHDRLLFSRLHELYQRSNPRVAAVPEILHVPVSLPRLNPYSSGAQYATSTIVRLRRRRKATQIRSDALKSLGDADWEPAGFSAILSSDSETIPESSDDVVEDTDSDMNEHSVQTSLVMGASMPTRSNASLDAPNASEHTSNSSSSSLIALLKAWEAKDFPYYRPPAPSEKPVLAPTSVDGTHAPNLESSHDAYGEIKDDLYLRSFYMRAIDNHEENKLGYLSYKKGDVIHVSIQNPKGRCFGNLNGVTGWFDSKYCERVFMDDLKAPAMKNVDSENEDWQHEYGSELEVTRYPRPQPRPRGPLAHFRSYFEVDIPPRVSPPSDPQYDPSVDLLWLGRASPTIPPSDTQHFESLETEPKAIQRSRRLLTPMTMREPLRGRASAIDSSNWLAYRAGHTPPASSTDPQRGTDTPLLPTLPRIPLWADSIRTATEAGFNRPHRYTTLESDNEDSTKQEIMDKAMQDWNNPSWWNQYGRSRRMADP